MKIKIIIAIIASLGLAGGAYVYVTRPVEAPSETTDQTLQQQESVSQGSTYRIGGTSTVEFRINEVLHGKPFTAVGTTSAINGDIIVDGDNVTFGTISVNARTFKTDSQQRDGAIARLILESEDDENESIVFTPTNTVKKSDHNFTVTGNLTISGITKPAVMDIILNVEGDVLTGTATTTIKRSDFDLTIPNIPFVASVDDNFTVKVTVTAQKVK